VHPLFETLKSAYLSFQQEERAAMPTIDPVFAFGQHLLTGIAFLGIFLVIYLFVTPHKEIALIRAGNGAAALGLMGAVFGFSIALSRAIEVSTYLAEAAIWAGIALVAQIVAQFVAQLAFPKLYAGIENNEWAPAIVKAGLAISVGLINAACMTP
jgi:putative membrane protein